MKSQKINLLLGKLCAKIGEGHNLIAPNSTFTCTTNVIRICAKENSSIKSSVFGEDNIGIYLPAGAIEYFEVDIDDIITLISGSINISSID